MTARARWRSAAAIILIYAVSRGLLVGAGLLGASVLPSGRGVQSGNLQRPWVGPLFLEIWARWDSEWYLLIAERGYHLEDALASRRVAYEPPDATGFFPLYPLLIRGTGAALGRLPVLDNLMARSEGALRSPDENRRAAAMLLAAIVLSNAALLGSLFLLDERVRATSPGESPGAAPAAASALSCAALLCFPPSLFLSAAYAESLLLFLTLLCFRCLRQERWTAAAAMGALASATKPSGLLLLIPAAAVLFRSAGAVPETRASRRLSRWLTLPVYPAGAAAFSIYCAREFGDPLCWMRRQERWRGAVSGPWRAFVRWAGNPVVHGAHGSTVELVFALFALILLMLALRRRPVAESLFAACVLVLPLCSTLWSYGRLSVQAFPIFIVAGSLAARRPAFAAACFAPAAAGSAVLMACFAAWWWAG